MREDVVSRPIKCAKGIRHIPLGAPRSQPKGKIMVCNNGFQEATKEGHLRKLGRAALKGQDQELKTLLENVLT